MSSDASSQPAWFLQSSCPVVLPAFEELTKPRAEFEKLIANKLIAKRDDDTPSFPVETGLGNDDTFTLVSASTSAEIREKAEEMRLDEPKETNVQEDAAQGESEKPGHAFMQALLSHQDKKHKSDLDVENKMLTENGAVAFRSTKSALVDLFSELDEVDSGPRLLELLESAWKEDPLMILKLIFNSRSIHLGQSSRSVFYRCAGWLAQKHPLTLITNLRWLCRPVIQKKVKKTNEDDDTVLVEPELAEDDDAKHDVKYGVSHGYWKDLLNMLVLAVNKKFSPLANPKDILNSQNSWSRTKSKHSGGSFKRRSAKIRHDNPEADEETKQQPTGPVEAKEARKETRKRRHEAALEALQSDPVYFSLHITISRLFAEQLKADIAALRGNDKKAKRDISLCGKWAPSHDRFHDRHTFIVSSIAEILYPRESLEHLLSPSDTRETYIRYAREEYRKDVSALRKHLDVVERNITAGTFDQIKYDRLPSTAMKNYVPLFIEKDFKRFEEYLQLVASGKAKISGATLLPSQMIRIARTVTHEPTPRDLKNLSPAKIIEKQSQFLKARAMDGQWKSLVQRIKDSGTLSSSIAVCDVSGSMLSPTFEDDTCPMDTAIGLSLLIAEVTEPPFGGSFITFSQSPKVVKIDLSESLSMRYQQLVSEDWGMNTDFVAVFEKLLLPIAVNNKLKPEDMVKRLFVFSDMQFDSACRSWDSTTYEIIKAKYQEAGYEMPEIVFWNLAGGRAGFGAGNSFGDPTAPKPVTVEENGTSMVSGYSQATLKVFLEGSTYNDEEEETAEEIETKEESDDETVAIKKRKASAMDPTSIMKKAIGHKAYDMLRVMD